MKKTLGTMIAELRKQHGMTQLELAEKMGVTDKAVSKWERDLSCPDINSIPDLAEILGVSVEDLMQVKKEAEAPVSKVAEIMEIAPKAVAMAMGIAVNIRRKKLNCSRNCNSSDFMQSQKHIPKFVATTQH